MHGEDRKEKKLRGIWSVHTTLSKHHLGSLVGFLVMSQSLNCQFGNLSLSLFIVDNEEETNCQPGNPGIILDSPQPQVRGKMSNNMVKRCERHASLLMPMLIIQTGGYKTPAIAY